MRLSLFDRGGWQGQLAGQDGHGGSAAKHAPRTFRYAIIVLLAFALSFAPSNAGVPADAPEPTQALYASKLASRDEPEEEERWVLFVVVVVVGIGLFIHYGSTNAGSACSANISNTQIAMDTSGTLYVGTTRDATVSFTADSCGEGEFGPFDVEIQVMDGGQWRTAQDATMGASATNKKQDLSIKVPVQMAFPGSARMRAVITEAQKNVSGTSGEITFVITNPIGASFSPATIDVVHTHPVRAGHEQDIVITNQSPKSFHLDYVAYADKSWDSGLGDVSGGGQRSFTACVTYDCATTHSEAEWSEYYRYRGYIRGCPTIIVHPRSTERSRFCLRVCDGSGGGVGTRRSRRSPESCCSHNPYARRTWRDRIAL